MSASQPGTAETLAQGLATALSALLQRLDGVDAKTLLSEMGLFIPEGTPELVSALRTTALAADVLPDMTTELVAAVDAGSTVEMVSRSAALAQQVVALTESIEAIVTSIDAIAVPGLTPAEIEAYVAEYPVRVAEKMFVEQLEGSLAHALLSLVGLLETRLENAEAEALNLLEYDRKALRFDRLGALLSRPEDVLEELYGWGGSDFDGNEVVDRLALLLRALRAPAAYYPLSDGRTVLEAFLLSVRALAPASGPGLLAALKADVPAGLNVSVELKPGLLFEFESDVALDAGTQLRFEPPNGLRFIPPSGSIQGSLEVGFAGVPVAPREDITLLGVAGGTGLFASKVSARLTSGFSWDSGGGEAAGNLGFAARVEGATMRVAMGDADGFLANLLAGSTPEAAFDVGLGWRAGGGVYFEGSGGLSVQLASHIDLGVVELSAITLSGNIESDSFPIELTLDVTALLGPLVAVVEQVGARFDVSFPSDGRGNLGPAQLDASFKPPVGVGLSLDAGVVLGGGYLYFDHEAGEYAGALELNLMEIVAVKAIGLVTTQMPDGTEGFSLLIVITAEFGTGLQIGFGFTLLAVGGILGLNRGMALDAIVEGVRTESIDSVMFPTDVVANAQSIISDLKAYFPVEEDVFLVGPLAKLGWGTPTLISLSLGVIVEVPPGNIAILGVLSCRLPDEEAALLVLQVSFVGALEIDRQRAWFFASLFGSRVLTMTLDGEMGVLVAWGSEPNFVVSVGGFHPSFQPPTLPFPVPNRVAVMILNESWGRIRVDGYFAVTSNTAQFGASLEIWFGFSEFSLDGYLGIDALFQFSPFYFIVEVSGHLALSVVGLDLLSVHLSFSLEGPTPWRAQGRGSVKLLFFTVKANFDETWGDSANTTLQPIEVMPIVEAEFAKEENWVAVTPAANSLSVSLTEIPESTTLLLHPLGSLKISQRAVPLAIDIDKVGNQAASDATHFEVGVNGGSFEKLGESEDSFATGQYLELSDDERLSRPGYENERSGVEVGAAGSEWSLVAATVRTVRYELVIIDSHYKRYVKMFLGLFTQLFGVLLNRNAATLSPVSQASQLKLVPYAEKTEVLAGSYAVAFSENNVAIDAAATSFTSQAQADQYVRERVSEDPTLASSLHVIEVHEVNQAA